MFELHLGVWLKKNDCLLVILISYPNHKFISSEEVEGEVHCRLHGRSTNDDFSTSCGARARHLTGDLDYLIMF